MTAIVSLRPCLTLCQNCSRWPINSELLLLSSDLIYTSIKFELAQGGYCTEINSRQTFAAGKNCSIVSGEHKGLWDCP